MITHPALLPNKEWKSWAVIGIYRQHFSSVQIRAVCVRLIIQIKSRLIAVTKFPVDRFHAGENIFRLKIFND